MAIDFPVPTQVGELFTDPTSGNIYECTQVGPPAVWMCATASPTPEEYVTLDTTQTVTGVKTFTGQPVTLDGSDLAMSNLRLYTGGGIEPELQTVGASMDLQNGIAWSVGSITVPNPTNAQPGMSGMILVTAAPTAWGANFKFPGGVGNAQPTIDSYPAMIPYFVQDASNILLGAPTSF